MDELQAENTALREQVKSLLAENVSLIEQLQSQHWKPWQRITSVEEAELGVTGSSMVAFTDPLQLIPSGPCNMKKIVYLVRHAEAAHNVVEAKLREEAKSEGLDEAAQLEAAKAALPDERFRDALLSNAGQDQVTHSGQNFEQLLEQTLYHMPKTVLVSPLRRSLMTANIMFPGHPDVRVTEMVRERRTGFPCDERQAAAVSKLLFPSMDWSELDTLDASSDDGHMYSKGLLETYNDVGRRGDKLLPFIESLEADIIAVVSHKGFIRELFRDSWKDILKCPEGLNNELDNAEVRVCLVSWSSGSPPSIVMRSLTAATVSPTVKVNADTMPSIRARKSQRKRIHSSCLSAAIGTSDKDDIDEAVNEVWQYLIDQMNCPPSVAFVFGHCSLDAARVAARLRRLQPSLSVVGGSSMTGVLTPSGSARFGMMGFDCWARRCGVSHVNGTAIHDAFSAREAGIKAATDATQGSMPNIIIICASSGFEEHILAGINRVCKGVRIFGSSSSNDSLVGGPRDQPWQLYGGLDGWGAISDGGLVLLALWQHEHSNIHSVLSHCYGKTEYDGLITRAEGRYIYEIDHRPAGDVFLEWTGLTIPCPHKSLAEFALAIGDRVDHLVHIQRVGSSHELRCYASTACDLGCSSASLARIKPSALTSAIREVVGEAKKHVDFQIRAALVVVGAGVGSLLDEDGLRSVQATLTEICPEALLVFSLGGQGNSKSGYDAYHGNNMLNFLFIG